MRENTQELLEPYSYDYVYVENGKECLDLALIKPDLIVCEIMLPFLSGYNIKQQLNYYDETVNIPFIFLSAKIECVDKEKGFKLGAGDSVVKPFKIAELFNSIEKNLIQKSNPQ